MSEMAVSEAHPAGAICKHCRARLRVLRFDDSGSLRARKPGQASKTYHISMPVFPSHEADISPRPAVICPRCDGGDLTGASNPPALAPPPGPAAKPPEPSFPVDPPLGGATGPREPPTMGD